METANSAGQSVRTIAANGQPTSAGFMAQPPLPPPPSPPIVGGVTEPILVVPASLYERYDPPYLFKAESLPMVDCRPSRDMVFFEMGSTAITAESVQSIDYLQQKAATCGTGSLSVAGFADKGDDAKLERRPLLSGRKRFPTGYCKAITL